MSFGRDRRSYPALHLSLPLRPAPFCRPHSRRVLWVQDFSWEDHGFSLVNRLYSDIGHLLDERFRCVAALPFPRGPDLRRAVWNYIHCMFGIR